MSKKADQTQNQQEIEQTELEQTTAAQPEQAGDGNDAAMQELNDKYLRLCAEFDNYKKRTAKEKTQIYTDAAADVVEAILPTIDNLQRAIDAQEEESPMKDGVKMILKQLEDSLAAIGVEKIEAVGQPFDPELHNAVMHVEDESLGTNVVVDEFATGYKYRDKVIRHSMVRVAN